jgi:tetratricopeptide (TPR) repeat protein
VPGRGDLVFLDTGFDLPAADAAQRSSPRGGPPAPAADIPLIVDAPPPEGLELTQLDPYASAPAELDGASLSAAEPLPGLEQTIEADLELGSIGSVPGLELDAPPEEIQFDGVPLDQMDEPDQGTLEGEPAGGLVDIGDDLVLELAATEMDFATVEPEADLDLDFVDDEVATSAATAGLPLIEPAPATEPADELGELEDRIVDDPENPDLHRELADRLLLIGDLPRAAEEMRLALEGYEHVEDWSGASAIADRLVALEPDAIHHHQKRVELAFRTGERAPLIDAYLSLGEALGRAGAIDKALAVYGRVHEHDPDNPRAAAAIAALRPPPKPHATMATPAPPASRPAPPPPGAPPAPPAPPTSTGGSFVDLGSMILEETAPRDTRMRVDRREPEDEDEQREFKEILEQFKRGIEENLDSDDYEAHYDLGVAFKEMGLLDEAIAEFQKALRAPDGRLRTSEALGMAFFEKGQFAVSEAVLRRAVDAVEGGDEAKIGLIYWLGRSLEALGKSADAITSYERAMAVDIRFMDLSDRIHRLTAGRRE